MKKTVATLILAAFLALSPAFAQDLRYTEASDLTLVGKLFPDTPNPYHRVDTVKYKGFTKSENRQVRESAGIAVAFRTNSKVIRIKTRFGEMENPSNTMGISASGYDLYIRDKDGQWLWAADGPRNRRYEEVNLASALDGTLHECLLYLPLLSEEYSVQIGVEKGAVLEALENPFRHRVGIFGSSFTHGISTSRPGMTYPAQFARHTGIQLLSLGCSGNSKLQPYFAAALADAPVDAFIFDSFSNPTVEEIQERLFPFIERLVKAHPGKPLIFQRTIYREGRNFDTAAAKKESDRIACADSLMAIACAKYPDVYYIHPCATSPDHESTVDGIHPDNHGYTLWARSIEEPVMAILRKYGIE